MTYEQLAHCSYGCNSRCISIPWQMTCITLHSKSLKISKPAAGRWARRRRHFARRPRQRQARLHSSARRRRRRRCHQRGQSQIHRQERRAESVSPAQRQAGQPDQRAAGGGAQEVWRCRRGMAGRQWHASEECAAAGASVKVQCSYHRCTAILYRHVALCVNALHQMCMLGAFALAMLYTSNGALEQLQR